MSFPIPEDGHPLRVEFANVSPGDDAVYLIERKPALALRAALLTKRPLLVRGEPGIGKTQLARAAAEHLGRRFERVTVNARTETNELLWTVDHVERLARAQMARTQTEVDNLKIDDFVRPGPVWRALNPASARTPTLKEPPVGPKDRSGTVLLIDEIDKADTAIPNGLLEALGKRTFTAPRDRTVSALDGVPAPLIIFTTNRERFLPNAFLRRCWVLELAIGDDIAGYLRVRGEAHFGTGAFTEDVWTQAASIVEAARQDRAEDAYRPGVAEYIELLRAVHAEEPKERGARLEDLREFITDKQGC